MSDDAKRALEEIQRAVNGWRGDIDSIPAHAGHPVGGSLRMIVTHHVREGLGVTAEPEEITHPATVVVHWPSGPVACCVPHAEQLVGLGSFLGSHIVTTPLTEPANCVNCANEAGVPS